MTKQRKRSHWIKNLETKKKETAMEHKVGEIFEYNGEWYQCVEGSWCRMCDFHRTNLSAPQCDYRLNCFLSTRKDNKSVIFKKLKKVGEPSFANNPGNNVLQQRYKLYEPMVTLEGCWYRIDGNFINIEIKQNKEDMEENELIELLSEKVHNAWMKEKEAQGFSYGKEYNKEKKKHPDMLPYNELKEKVKEYDRATVKAVLQDQKELSADVNKLNLKPFSLEAAKAGKPVCTRDGRKARIICFDAKGDKPIIALVEMGTAETPNNYPIDGKAVSAKEASCDLMMLPEKKEGWVNVYKREGEYICENECSVSTGIGVYKSEGEAKRNIDKNEIYVNTIKINWSK